MLLPVLYTDGTFDFVKDFMLSPLIEACKIIKFKRSSGWVEIDSPYVRRSEVPGAYFGPERRLH